jgi:hypothetical protein
MRTTTHSLDHVEDILPNARTLTDSAITFAHTSQPEDLQKAVQALAAATQYQNIALRNLCSAVRKLLD